MRHHHTMSYADLHFDAKTAIAHTSISAWNALMRADPVFGRYALSDIGRSAFITAFTVIDGNAWWVGGRLHRTGGPAVVYTGVNEWWYEYGRPHRIGGPARTFANGREEWFERGKPHRAGGQPAVIWHHGKEWYERGQRHRVGGPAIVYVDCSEVWFERDKIHRIGGPARTYANGLIEYWEHGVLIESKPPA